jgi:hypothetical protein
VEATNEKEEQKRSEHDSEAQEEEGVANGVHEAEEKESNRIKRTCGKSHKE